jgi:hypothetical protein
VYKRNSMVISPLGSRNRPHIKANFQCKKYVHVCACNLLQARSRNASVPSGWADTANDGADQVDRLHNLGKAQNYNINVDHGVTTPADVKFRALLRVAR